MNVLLRLYLAVGLAFVLGAYFVTLFIWFNATLNGLFNGQYVAAVNTNALGENDLIVLLLFVFLPAAAWTFTRGLRRVLRPEKSN